ncbi:hypothetical protein [Leptolyngbya ohadii]|uniref:hypothetical protein n=1 Tax=Leptolyngbya ohadii TaxID=1962290 RepID=UPI000B59B19C|nr:hypothetical protein [Leptolyngbya ohadii]
MDVSQLQIAIEQFLNLIQSHGPAVMQGFVALLTAIKTGATSIGALATLISNYPALTQVIDKLIVLLNSGATIPEISATIAELSASLGLSTQALLDLLYMVGGALMLF